MWRKEIHVVIESEAMCGSEEEEAILRGNWERLDGGGSGIWAER